MPDGPTQKGPDYDDDFYAWTQHHAAVLREMPVTDSRFDRENIAEEIESLGRDHLNTAHQQVRYIVENLLKLQYLRADRERYAWMGTALEARNTLDDKLCPSLRKQIEADLPRLYRHGKELAELGFRAAGQSEAIVALPNLCPYTLDQICDDDWYPEPVETP